MRKATDYADAADYMVKEYKIQEDWMTVKEPNEGYFGSELLNDLTYKIIGICFEVPNELGPGFLEAVYKVAVEYELKKQSISFIREKKYEIKYKDTILKHYYSADFIVENSVILEAKAQKGVVDDHVKQVINYLAASKCPIGLLINFGESSLKYKRIVLSK